MANDAISEEGRRTRFERWETLGLDRVKADLESGGWQVVGGPPAVRDLAWEWVRMKEAEKAAATNQEKPAEIFTFKPGVYGTSIDLKELGQRVLKWLRARGKDK